MSTQIGNKMAAPPLIQGTDNFLAVTIDDIKIENNRIMNLDPPINGKDAANKEYVDSASGGSPGIPDTSVQFNNAGSFGGSTNLTWDNVTNTLGVTGDATVSGFIAIPTAPVNPIDAANKAYVDASSGTPGGSNTQIQFNNLGTFEGNSNLTWDGTYLNTSNALVSNTLTLPLPPVNGTDATNKSYVDAATGSAPGGNASNVQFNSTPAGVFTGSDDFSWNNITNELTINGTVFADNYQTTSEVGFKSNVLPINDPLSTINKLEGFSYNLNGNKQRTYGVMAQDLQKHEDLKDLVKPCGDHQTVDYQQMIPMLVEGIKKLGKENEAIRKDINDKNRVYRRKRRSRPTIKY